MPKGYPKGGWRCKAAPVNLALGKQEYNRRCTQVSLEADLFNTVRNLALENDISFSEQVRRLVATGLQHYENN